MAPRRSGRARAAVPEEQTDTVAVEDSRAADGQNGGKAAVASAGTKRSRKSKAASIEEAPEVAAEQAAPPKRGRKAAVMKTEPPAEQAAAAKKGRRGKAAPAIKPEPAQELSDRVKDEYPAEQPEQASSEPRFYLFKSEPHKFPIQQLEKEPQSTSPWDGVRNYTARNLMGAMRQGERAFFYHSSCKVPGIVGLVEVVREAYPDHTAWDPKSDYHDPKASPDNPRWQMVDVKLVRKLKRCITLEELKGYGGRELAGMALLSQGRLSVQPVKQLHWDFILGLEDEEVDNPLPVP